MTGTWIGLVVFTTTLTAQIDKEFTTIKECWDWYNIPSNGSKIGTPLNTHQQNKPIPEDHHYPLRLYKDADGHLIWLTCENSANMKGNDVSKNFPLNILLPTPISIKS